MLCMYNTLTGIIKSLSNTFPNTLQEAVVDVNTKAAIDY